MNLARAGSDQRVMSVPASLMEPIAAMKVPANRLGREDLPEPLVPMMIRNEPVSNRSETPRRARTSLGVPGLKVLWMPVISSMSGGGRFGRGFEFAQDGRRDERDKDEGGGDEFEVVGI